MTYDSQNTSVHDSQPVDFFDFVGPGSKHYRYCDADQDITLAGDVYEHVAISRSNIAVGTSIGDDQQVTIRVPYNTEVAIDNGYLESPESLTVTIYRGEIDDSGTVVGYKTDWEGSCQGFSGGGLGLSIVTRPISVGFNSQLVSAYWQRTCNFDLYDTQTCKANRATFTKTTTVTIVGPDAITVADDQFDDGDLVIGEVTNTRTGEKRLIVDNVVNVVTLSHGFVDVVVGDTVQLTRGCQHNTADCFGVFNNIVNYGGFIYIPRKSPLTSNYQPGSVPLSGVVS